MFLIQHFCASVLLCNYFTTSYAYVNVNLNGTDWILFNETSVKYRATIPGDVYSALLNNGIVQNLLYQKNDVNTRWISYSNWTYIKVFRLTKEVLLNAINVSLTLDGADTVVHIFINKMKIGQMNNMYIKKRMYFDKIILSEVNTIELRFESPVAYALRQSQAYNYTVPPECNPPERHGECHFNFIRKMASSFSWDWGPAFPTMGIWKSIELELWQCNSIHINYVKITNTQNEDDLWTSSVNISIEQMGKGQMCVNSQIKELKVKKEICKQVSERIENFNVILKNIVPMLWWPNGMGLAKLYKLQIFVRHKEKCAPECRSVVIKKTLTTGFRKVQLIQKPLSHGNTFYFTINDYPIFIKGSNWVPGFLFPNAMNHSERYHYFLSSAQISGINTLRVWGGGMFEYDSFYDLADRLGLLIWHDFMFACSLYPVNDAFLQNVKEEITYNVRHLHNHPSVILWSGNNENEVAIASNWYNIPDDKISLYKADYVKLYIETILETVSKENREIIFVSSSPSNGVESAKEGWIATNPQDNRYGDVHYYVTSGDLWNSSSFPIPRFTSEFGFQSFPSLETWQTASENQSDWTIDGELMKYRQHGSAWDFALNHVWSQYLSQPSMTKNVALNYTRYAFLNQLNQAMIYKCETEKLLRWRCEVNNEALGYSMGSMFWQLNDVWQAPTWASIEVHGKWKVVQYFVKRYYASSILSPYIDNNDQLNIYYVSHKIDEINTRIVDQLKISCWNYTDILLPTGVITVDIQKMSACGSFNIYQQPMESVLSQCGCPQKLRSKCFITTQLVQRNATNWILLASPKDILLSTDSPIIITSVVKSSDSFSITVQSKRPHLFVWLDMRNIKGWFEDNAFHLTSGEKVVHFYPWLSSVTLQDIEKAVSVTSLNMMYA